VACGGPTQGPGGDPTPPVDPDTSGTSEPGPGGPGTGDSTDSGDTTPSENPCAGNTSPSEAECQTLLDHFLTVAHASHAANLDPDEVPTGEQVAEIRKNLEPEFVAGCREFDRATYDCITRARSREAIAACASP